MRRLLAGVLTAVAVTLPVALQRNSSSSEPRVPVQGTHVPRPEVPSGVGDVTRLTPPMQRAVSRAIAAAAVDGIELRVTSGWRSREHQEALFAAAVRKYGSAALARRWVLPPDESAHVRGEAIDVGPEAAARWLDGHGVRFGLCRRYANEPWHFERLASAKGSACPALELHP